MKNKYWLAFAVIAVLAVGALSYSLGSGTSFQGRAALAVTHEKCLDAFERFGWAGEKRAVDYGRCKEQFSDLWRSMVQDQKLQLVGSTDGAKSMDVNFKTEMKLANIHFKLFDNYDGVKDTANLEKLRIIVTATNADASNFKLYPAARYNDDNYALPGRLVADDVIEFDFTKFDERELTDSSNEIKEGKRNTWIIKADTVSGTNGSLDVQVAYVGGENAVYGQNADLQWTDGVNTFAWFRNISGSGNLNLRNVSSSSSTGTPDPSLLDFQE